MIVFASFFETICFNFWLIVWLFVIILQFVLQLSVSVLIFPEIILFTVDCVFFIEVSTCVDTLFSILVDGFESFCVDIIGGTNPEVSFSNDELLADFIFVFVFVFVFVFGTVLAEEHSEMVFWLLKCVVSASWDSEIYFEKQLMEY